MGGGAIKLGSIRGIRIGADVSWFLVLFLIVVLLSSDYRSVLDVGQDSIVPYLLALASALAFFGSILLHELGHAFAARRDGIGISGITLWMFGGVARMERDTESPGSELRIALAGPAVTLALLALGVAVGVTTEGAGAFLDAAGLDEDAAVNPLTYLVAWTTFINAAVLVFNLIPAFPLDGGRVVRAIAWWRTNDRGSATRFAATLGRGFAFGFIGIGIYSAITGNLLSGLWMALIGWVLHGAATSAAAQTKVSGRLEGLSVRDVMDSEPVSIPDSITVEEALDGYFLRYRWQWFPVVDARGLMSGILRWGDVEEIPERDRPQTTIARVSYDAGESLRVRDDSSLEAVLGKEGLRSFGALVAVDPEGRLSGVLTVGRIGRALRGVFAPPPDPPPGVVG